jgi:hypothetical protein
MLFLASPHQKSGFPHLLKLKFIPVLEANWESPPCLQSIGSHLKLKRKPSKSSDQNLPELGSRTFWSLHPKDIDISESLTTCLAVGQENFEELFVVVCFRCVPISIESNRYSTWWYMWWYMWHVPSSWWMGRLLGRGLCPFHLCLIVNLNHLLATTFKFIVARFGSFLHIFNQWIGLRENLQETIDFPIKYGAFL